MRKLYSAKHEALLKDIAFHFSVEMPKDVTLEEMNRQLYEKFASYFVVSEEQEQTEEPPQTCSGAPWGFGFTNVSSLF